MDDTVDHRQSAGELYEFTPIRGLRTSEAHYGMARKLVTLDAKTAKRKALDRIKEHADIGDLKGAEIWSKIARIIEDLT
jgi:hypothetical protein